MLVKLFFFRPLPIFLKLTDEDSHNQKLRCDQTDNQDRLDKASETFQKETCRSCHPEINRRDIFTKPIQDSSNRRSVEEAGGGANNPDQKGIKQGPCAADGAPVQQDTSQSIKDDKGHAQCKVDANVVVHIDLLGKMTQVLEGCEAKYGLSSSDEFLLGRGAVRSSPDP